MSVESTLQDLKCRADQSGEDQQLFQYFHKLALIELCGWIEVAQDQMVNECATHLHVSNDPNSFLSDKIKKNHGFTYEGHFRGLLSLVVGLGIIEKIERDIDQSVFVQFKSTLNDLKTKRNGLAHTYLGATQATTDSPTVCLAHHKIVCDGLNALREKLRERECLPAEQS
jgi:hypothetical protein